MPTLSTAIASLLTAAGGYHLSYDGTSVNIDYGDWTGVTLSSVQTQVTGCAARTYRTDAKNYVNNMDVYIKAAFLVALDEVNTLRTSAAPIGTTRTPAQFWAAILAKVDTL